MFKSFFKVSKHRRFDYTPRYYNPDAEQVQKRRASLNQVQKPISFERPKPLSFRDSSRIYLRWILIAFALYLIISYIF